MLNDYSIKTINPNDSAAISRIDALLSREGIHRDTNLDYICAIVDSMGKFIATGSCFQNTLRCFAVDSLHQGEGLLADLLLHLVHVQFDRGNTNLFLYTKPDAARLFSALGFYEIARVENTLVFMENRKNGFSNYLKKLEKSKKTASSAAIVMNANPFTLGHQYLVETASKIYDCVHVFVLSEDCSFFPFEIRKKLVTLGCAHLSNVFIHESGPYMISNATFPSYFIKDRDDVIWAQAMLDAAIFCQIAERLNISARFVGEEPKSHVTKLYNKLLSSTLPNYGIRCNIIPRKKAGNSPISASDVRLCLQRNDFSALHSLVPDSTYCYLTSPAAQPVISKIKNSESVIHY